MLSTWTMVPNPISCVKNLARTFGAVAPAEKNATVFKPSDRGKFSSSAARIMKGRPFEGMVRLVALTTKLTAQRSTL